MVHIFLSVASSFCVAHRKLSAETSNTSRTRYYTRISTCIEIWFYEASFASYGVICLLCLPLLAIWTSPKAKLSTVDCLEADRFRILLQDSSAGPEKSCKQAMEAISLVVRRAAANEHCRHAQWNCGQHCMIGF